MIAETSIDAVRELSIYDVVSKYNDIELKKTGSTYRAKSPWVDEKTPSFYVVPGRNFFKDFSTGKGGNPITFVMEKENVEWLEAVKILASAHNITLEYDNNAPKQEDNKAKADIRLALEWACAHFCAHSVPESFTKYRAFPDEVLAPFKVGYAQPGWNDLLESAKKNNISLQSLLAAGLVRENEKKDNHYDYFRDRIMFPILDYRGNVVAFTGRDAETQAPKEGEKIPKYINSPDSCYNKSAHLYGIYQAIKGGKLKDGAYLVEGPTDVIRWHKHTFTNTVSPCGSAFTEEQAKLLKRFTDKLTIVPDNDCDKVKNAGLDALHANAIVAIKAGFTVKVLIPGSK